MRTLLAIVILFVVCVQIQLFGLCNAVRAQEIKDVKKDAYGDPLPPGAIARLGTLRLNHGMPVNKVAFSQDETLLFSAAGDGVRVWNVRTGQEVNHFPTRTSVDTIAVSPDGSFLAVGFQTTDVCLYEIRSGKIIKTLRAKELYWGLKDLAFIRDGSQVMAVDKSARAAIWDWQNETLIWQKTDKIPVQHARISADPVGFYFSDGLKPTFYECRVSGNTYDLRTLYTPETKDAGPHPFSDFLFRKETLYFAEFSGVAAVKCGPADVDCSKLRYSFGGSILTENRNLFACGERDGFIYLFQPDRLKELKRLRHWGRVTALSFSASNKYLASATWGGTICLWNLEKDGADLAFHGYDDGVSDLAFVDNRTILSRKAKERTFYVDDFLTGKGIRQLDPAQFAGATLVRDADTFLTPQKGLEQNIIDISQETSRRIGNLDRFIFHPKGDGFASWEGWPKRVSFWENTGDKPALTLTVSPIRSTLLTAAAFSPDGTLLVVGSSSGFLKCFDWKSRKEVGHCQLPTDRNQNKIRRILLAKDNKSAVIQCKDGVWVWDIVKNEKVAELLDSQCATGCFALSPALDQFAIAWSHMGGDTFTNYLALWEMKSFAKIGEFRAHRDRTRTTRLAFSPDARRLASGASDNTVLIWDLKSLASTAPLAKERK
ncbi:MAG: WD40 repeat domain-containing protein [Gemmataceae bacterium]|nr:WD40 repeat domain-containing protein [Gemmataceae bacterium]